MQRDRSCSLAEQVATDGRALLWLGVPSHSSAQEFVVGDDAFSVMHMGVPGILQQALSALLCDLHPA